MMAAAAYARIASDLREKIARRDIKPGGQLPTELELRGTYQASRNTVLDAIKILKDEGLVETRPGQGWFAKVNIEPFVNSIDWEDAAAIMAAVNQGRNPEATPPVVTQQDAPQELADRLEVATGTKMVVRRQEWLLDGLPWKTQVVWCPAAHSYQGAERLLVAEDIPEGVGSYLYRSLGLQPDGASFYFLPRKPSLNEARIFGFSDENDVPYVIELIRTEYVAGDSGPRPLYVAAGVYPCDRNRFASFRPAGSGDQPTTTSTGTR
jgi:GntR family transcriptional regulator